MAKAKAIYFYLFCFFVCSSVAGQSDLASPCSKLDQESKRLLLKQIYSNEVGVKEQGGANRGKRVEEYLASVGFGPGFAWCASFVSWCFQQVGIEAPKSAWVPSFASKSKMVYKRGTFTKKIPEAGDVFMIWYSRLKRPAHIGFIDRWEDEWVITVEGNTNNDRSREGDGVYRKRRLERQIWAVSDFIGSD